MGCAGIMHTDVTGIGHTDALGDIPIAPVRFFGIIATPPALGDIHSGVLKGVIPIGG